MMQRSLLICASTFLTHLNRLQERQQYQNVTGIESQPACHTTD